MESACVKLAKLFRYTKHKLYKIKIYDIIFMPKLDWVSWDEIHEVILTAHKKNIEKGLVKNTITFSGKEIKEYLGKEG